MTMTLRSLLAVTLSTLARWSLTFIGTCHQGSDHLAKVWLLKGLRQLVTSTSHQSDKMSRPSNQRFRGLQRPMSALTLSRFSHQQIFPTSRHSSLTIDLCQAKRFRAARFNTCHRLDARRQKYRRTLRASWTMNRAWKLWKQRKAQT